MHVAAAVLKFKNILIKKNLFGEIEKFVYHLQSIYPALKNLLHVFGKGKKKQHWIVEKYLHSFLHFKKK